MPLELSDAELATAATACRAMAYQEGERGLYVLIGCCWLPVVWLQIQMRNLAVTAAEKGEALPSNYFRYYRWWFGLGWPAFLGVLAVFYLMVAKPGL